MFTAAVYLFALSMGLQLQYEALVDSEAKAHSLDEELVKAVIQVESGWNPEARSDKNALGLMQLLPSTIASVGGDPRGWADPENNIHWGLLYIQQLLQLYGDDSERVLSHYYSGKGANVDRADVREYIQKVKAAYVRIHQGTYLRYQAGRVAVAAAEAH